MFKNLKPFLVNYKKEFILGPFFKLLEAVFELLLPIYLANLIDNGLIKHNVQSIYHNTIIIILLSIIGLGCVLICQYFASITSQGIGTKLRTKCLNSIINIQTYNQSSIEYTTAMTNLTSDINQLQQAIAMLIRLVIRAPFLTIGSIFMSFKIHWIFGCLFLIIVPIFIGLLLFIMKINTPLYEQTQHYNDQINKQIKDITNGQVIIKTFNQSDYMTKVFEKSNKKYTSLAIKAGKYNSLLQPMTILVINLSTLIILLVSYSFIDHKTILPGQLVALITYMNQMLLSLIVISNLINIFTKALASLKRLNPLLKDYSTQDDNNIPVSNKPINLILDNVSWEDSSNNQKVLKNININIKNKANVGIVGLSGSGKSTLLKLIQRELKPSSGIIYNNHQNIQDYKFIDWQKLIAITTQKPILFNDSIQENLTFNNEISTKQIYKVLNQVHLEEEIKKLTSKLNTVITNNANNFSGGQKQRLTLARALLKNTQILLLDDPFTSLDYNTSQIIISNLLENYQNTTKVIISNQKHILQKLDYIYVLDEGKLVEEGTHQALIKKSKLYQKIITTN